MSTAMAQRSNTAMSSATALRSNTAMSVRLPVTVTAANHNAANIRSSTSLSMANENPANTRSNTSLSMANQNAANRRPSTSFSMTNQKTPNIRSSTSLSMANHNTVNRRSSTALSMANQNAANIRSSTSLSMPNQSDVKSVVCKNVSDKEDAAKRPSSVAGGILLKRKVNQDRLETPDITNRKQQSTPDITNRKQQLSPDITNRKRSIQFSDEQTDHLTEVLKNLNGLNGLKGLMEQNGAECDRVTSPVPITCVVTPGDIGVSPKTSLNQPSVSVTIKTKKVQGQGRRSGEGQGRSRGHPRLLGQRRGTLLFVDDNQEVRPSLLDLHKERVRSANYMARMESVVDDMKDWRMEKKDLIRDYYYFAGGQNQQPQGPGAGDSNSHPPPEAAGVAAGRNQREVHRLSITPTEVSKYTGNLKVKSLTFPSLELTE